MKAIRKEYPKVRQTVKSGNTYYVVDLRRKHYKGPQFKWFNKREPALKYAGEIGSKVARDGLNSISFTIGTDPRIKAWTEQFAIFNKSLDEAINAALAVFEQERKVKESPFMSELLTVWMDDKTTNPLKPLRPRSEKSIRHMVNLFQREFGDTRIKEIDRNRVESYLQNKDVSNQTRKNLLNYLHQFFNWAIKKSFHHTNPAHKIEITVPNSVPQFFTVDDCIRIMEQAVKHDMVSYFGLCLFAGVRPNEVERMTWDNINLDTKEIHLNPSQTKTKKSRLFIISDNLAEWLECCDKNKPLVNLNHKKLKSKVIEGLQCDWIADGLRHTFATYHYAQHSNLEMLRKIMGNSPNVIERFYRGSISREETDKFWSIKP